MIQTRPSTQSPPSFMIVPAQDDKAARGAENPANTCHGQSFLGLQCFACDVMNGLQIPPPIAVKPTAQHVGNHRHRSLQTVALCAQGFDGVDCGKNVFCNVVGRPHVRPQPPDQLVDVVTQSLASVNLMGLPQEGQYE